ncbi:hypothetical protein [Flavobacterium maritimum]|uniref:hypothetical protein n=1 Tax=Flavobacterium maritimum TaxID=3149042 RepID=UPI0032B46F59
MKKIPLLFLAYFDLDVIKRSLESFYSISDSVEIIVIENQSVNSIDIRNYLRDELKKGNINSLYFFYRNLSNNSIEIIISRELKKLMANEYFFISDGDLILDGQSSCNEIKSIMDSNQNLFACGITLDNKNLPLNNFPESINWIPKDISEENDHFESKTGAHLLMLRTSYFSKYWEFREANRISLTDSSMANYCYRFLKKKWARTKNSKALHLTWDSYNDMSHPYTIEKLKKTFYRTWNHKDYFSLVEFNSDLGEKFFFIDVRRTVEGLFFQMKRNIKELLNISKN